MGKNINSSNTFEHKLGQMFLKFYAALEDIAYTKHEINAADIIDFSEGQKKKILKRANG